MNRIKEFVMKCSAVMVCIVVLAVLGSGCRSSAGDRKSTDKVQASEQERRDNVNRESSRADNTSFSRDRIEQMLITDPAAKATHTAYIGWLKKQENPDKTEIANEQIILEALSGSFPSGWKKHMHSLGSVLNHQAWHLIITGKRFRAAEAMVKKAVELDGNECDYLDTLAELQYRRGKYAEAIATIRLALSQETDRGRPMGRGKRGYLKRQLRKFKRALKK